MDLIQSFIEKARRAPARIVYPEGSEPRILAAAVKAKQLGFAEPILLGAREEILKVAAEQKLAADGLQIVSPEDPAYAERYAAVYAAARGMAAPMAKRLVRKPLAFGGMMVKTGDADAMVGGIASATASVIQAAAVTIGFKPGMSTPSSFFIMIVPDFMGEKDKPFVFADCAVCVSPDARQLAEIGVASGTNAQVLLGLEPKIAFLSFSTRGSASHADVDKVLEAVKHAKALAPHLAIDGEFQADAAIVARVAQKKVKDASPVAGQANVLVFPDLDAGNICYKLVQYLAGAKAIGPIMQGFAKPVNDLSRGASVDDVIGVSAIAAIHTQGAKS